MRPIRWITALQILAIAVVHVPYCANIILMISTRTKHNDLAAASPAPHHSHLRYLDGLRGLAAIYVVLHHATERPNVSRHGVARLFAYGHYAVCLFIVLSGFCLMLSIVRKPRGYSARVFLSRRAWRILPPYYLSMLFSLTLISVLICHKSGTVFDVSIPVTLRDVATHFALIHNWSRSSALKIASPFWSIAVECQIYLLFPILLLFRRRLGATSMVFMVVVASVIAQLYIDHLLRNWLQYFICVHFLGLFAMGMLACEISFSNDELYRKLRNGAWSGRLLPVMGTLLVTANCGLHWVIGDVMVGLGAACLLVYVSQQSTNRLNRIMSWPPFATVGSFAYSIYLIHTPLLQVLWQYGLHRYDLQSAMDGVRTAFCVVLTVACAYLFHQVCERPFTNARSV